MAVYEVDPISRIEGHLGVKITETAGKVTEADVHGNLWRGFENFLIGRDPNDAITFTQRICGVCPVPHGTTATYAVEAAYGYNDMFQTGMIGAPGVGAGKGVPAKAVHIRNLILGSEFIMSSLTHFYHLAAPSYVQGPNIPPWTPYFADSYYHPLLLSAGHGTGDLTGVGGGTAVGGGTLPADDKGFSKDLWSAVIKQYVKALRIRRLTFEAGALFAGRMPMTSALVAGGVTVDKTKSLAARCDQFTGFTKEIGDFVVKEYVPVVLALGALYPNYDNLENAQTLQSNFPGLWELAGNAVGSTPSPTTTGYGAGCGNFLSWGGFPQANGTLATARGFVNKGDASATAITAADVASHLKEDIAYSRYTSAGTAGYTGTIAYPGNVDKTVPKRDDATKYSWLKAPRWQGKPMEVGPLARLVVAGLYPTYAATATDRLLATRLDTAYTVYTYTDTGGTGQTGLDPRMIGADLAVACVRTGIAKLVTSVDNGVTMATVVTDDPTYTPLAGEVRIGGLSKATILAGYTYANAGSTVIKRAYITGPLTTWVLNLRAGLSTMDRLRARALESYVLVQSMIGAFEKTGTGIAWNNSATAWIGQLKTATGDTYSNKPTPNTGYGFGAAEAPRGALMHFCTVEGQKIKKYQCVVPTTWNGAPKDSSFNPAGTEAEKAAHRGPIEQAMIGIPYSTAGAVLKKVDGTNLPTQGGVEALRVAQSFDPCIACAVH